MTGSEDNKHTKMELWGVWFMGDREGRLISLELNSVEQTEDELVGDGGRCLLTWVNVEKKDLGKKGGGLPN